MSYNQACNLFRGLDELFDEGFGDVKELDSLSTLFNDYCPERGESKRCDTDYERISAVAGYLFMNFITDNDIDINNDNDYYIQYFVMWISNKLYEIATNNYKYLNQPHENNLDKSIGNFNFLNSRNDTRELKDANITIMNILYLLFKEICKAVWMDQGKKTEIYEHTTQITQCFIIYTELSKFVNPCSPYLELLDHLKTLYDDYREAAIQNKIHGKYTPELLRRFPEIDKTTQKFNFTSPECKKVHEQLIKNAQKLIKEEKEKEEGKGKTEKKEKINDYEEEEDDEEQDDDALSSLLKLLTSGDDNNKEPGNGKSQDKKLEKRDESKDSRSKPQDPGKSSKSITVTQTQSSKDAPHSTNVQSGTNLTPVTPAKPATTKPEAKNPKATKPAAPPKSQLKPETRQKTKQQPTTGRSSSTTSPTYTQTSSSTTASSGTKSESLKLSRSAESSNPQKETKTPTTQPEAQQKIAANVASPQTAPAKPAPAKPAPAKPAPAKPAPAKPAPAKPEDSKSTSAQTAAKKPTVPTQGKPASAQQSATSKPAPAQQSATLSSTESETSKTHGKNEIHGKSKNAEKNEISEKSITQSSSTKLTYGKSESGQSQHPTNKLAYTNPRAITTTSTDTKASTSITTSTNTKASTSITTSTNTKASTSITTSTDTKLSSGKQASEQSLPGQSVHAKPEPAKSPHGTITTTSEGVVTMPLIKSGSHRQNDDSKQSIRVKRSEVSEGLTNITTTESESTRDQSSSQHIIPEYSWGSSKKDAQTQRIQMNNSSLNHPPHVVKEKAQNQALGFKDQGNQQKDAPSVPNSGSDKSSDTHNRVGNTQGNADHINKTVSSSDIRNQHQFPNSKQRDVDGEQRAKNGVLADQGIISGSSGVGLNSSGGGTNISKQSQKVSPETTSAIMPSQSPSSQTSQPIMLPQTPPVTSLGTQTPSPKPLLQSEQIPSIPLSSSSPETTKTSPITITVSTDKKAETAMSSIESPLPGQNYDSKGLSRR
ncbi:CIR protein, partial [Plasmodium chabaudi adami]